MERTQVVSVRPKRCDLADHEMAAPGRQEPHDAIVELRRSLEIDSGARSSRQKAARRP